MSRVLSLVMLAGAGCGSAPATPSTPATAESAESAETRTATLRIEGMTCAGCEASISVAAKAVPGVVSIDVSHEKGSAELAYDPSKTDPTAVAAAITDLGYRTTPADAVSSPAAPANAVTNGPDPEMAAICQAGCAAQEDYDPADVVAQPAAKVGDLTRCPVSGVVFQVQTDQPNFQKDGKTWYTCCGMCMGKLTENPPRFLHGT